MPHHTPSPTSSTNGLSSLQSAHNGDMMEACRVCGDSPAKMHYGVLACFGCKGFFRRTLKRPTQYTCRHNGKCVVDRHERNSCRFCRFQKCIQAGMDPKAVRPDRDATGRHLASRVARRQRSVASEGDGDCDTEWARKLPVEMRTNLMHLMNIELQVTGGDAHGESGTNLYPLQISSLRTLLEDPTILDGKRTEMRYEGYNPVESVSQLVSIAHRGLIAAVDWVDHLFELIEAHSVEDKMLLVKNGFASLMVFSTAIGTARAKSAAPNVLHLANFGYVNTEIGNTEEPYHLSGRVVPRMLDEVVYPLKQMHLKEEEAVLFKAIIILNPQLRGLSVDGSEMIADLRDRIQETLYHVVRETHPKEVASARFGNILLLLPSVMIIGNMITDNLSFVQFLQNADQLMNDVMNVEPNPDMLKSDQMMDYGDCERGMNHSESCSSLDSLGSSLGSSASSHNLQQVASAAQALDELLQQQQQQQQQAQQVQQPPTSQPNNMTYNYSSPSLSYFPPTSSASSSSSLPPTSTPSSSINPAASLPNLDQLPDSDPDYNITLTQDMFSDMRQNIQQTGVLSQLPQKQNGSGERLQTPPNSPDRAGAPSTSNNVNFSIGERPTFYVASTRHMFEVTTTPYNGYTTMGQQQSSTHMVQSPIMGQPPPQQPLGKSNSLPHQYSPQMNGWQQYEMSNGPMSGAPDAMDYDDSSLGFPDLNDTNYK